MNLSRRKILLSKAISASLNAGKEILNVYQSDDFKVQIKNDNSPLTIADKKAHNAIVSELEPLGIPIISEEGELIDYSKRKDWKQCWIIDPLDGTKEFIKRNDEFTVNIALIDNGVPVAGVIYVPVFKQLYFGDIELGSYRLDKIISWDANLEFAMKTAVKLPLDVKREVTVVVGSRSHMNVETRNYISQLEKESDVEILSKGSSLKLCLIAENKADVYPRFAPTMEWDIAAGHAIVAATGAKVMQLNTSEQLIYNKENLLNPWFICKR